MGRGDKQAAWKQVLKGGVGGRWMLAFGAGRWSWALVWSVTVSRKDRVGEWGRERENGRQGGESRLADGGQ